jgi:hypothetical protein
MDSTLAYSIAGGIALVFLFFLTRFAFRWVIRIAIVALILAALVGAGWVWFKSSSSSPKTKPRSTLTRKNVRYALACRDIEIRLPLAESRPANRIRHPSALIGNSNG